MTCRDDSASSLPLHDSPKPDRAKATGTDASSLVPPLVPNADKRCINGATAGNGQFFAMIKGSVGSVGDDKSSKRLSFPVKMEPSGNKYFGIIYILQ